MDHERIMLIYEFLSKNTDTAKGVTIADIQGFLAEKTNLRNVSVLTIRRDIDRLTSMGYDISKTNGAHNTAYYHMKGKGFTFNEIRFLVDSASRTLYDFIKIPILRHIQMPNLISMSSL